MDQCATSSEAWLDRAAALTGPILLKYTTWTQNELRSIIKRSYEVNDADVGRVANMAQRTPEWFRIRSGWVELDKLIFRGTLLSSSVVGHLPKKKTDHVFEESHYPDGGVKRFNMLYKTQGGTAYEIATLEEFLIVLRQHLGEEKVIVSAEEVGLRLNPKNPIFAASIDSKLHMFDTETMTYDTSGLEMKRRGDEDAVPPAEIPAYYFDQIMISMYIYGWLHYWFVFHSKNTFSIQLFAYNEKYWQRRLSELESWYWCNYWPALVLTHLGVLKFDAQLEGGFVLVGDEEKDAETIFKWAMDHQVTQFLPPCRDDGLDFDKTQDEDIDWDAFVEDAVAKKRKQTEAIV